MLLLGTTLPADARSVPVIMASVEATGQNADIVVLTYGTPVPRAQVEQDVSEIGRQTGWLFDAVEILGHTDPENPGGPAVYSAQMVTGNTIDRQAGVLPVRPLVMALRNYRSLMLVFDVTGPFVYRGNRQYSDANVDITMQSLDSGSRTYAFDVQVKNPSFSGLSPAADMGPRQTSRWPSIPLLQILSAVALALAAGGTAYWMLLRGGTR
jgi:hypothetical protein